MSADIIEPYGSRWRMSSRTMPRRSLRCWLGFHRWLYGVFLGEVGTGLDGVAYSRRCLRCDERWAWGDEVAPTAYSRALGFVLRATGSGGEA